MGVLLAGQRAISATLNHVAEFWGNNANKIQPTKQTHLFFSCKINPIPGANTCCCRYLADSVSGPWRQAHEPTYKVRQRTQPTFPYSTNLQTFVPQTGHVAPPQGPWDMPPGPPLLLKALPGFAPWDQSVPTPLDRRAISRRQKEKRPHGQLSASPPSCKCDLCFIFTQKYKLGCPLIASRVMEAASHGNQSMPGQPSPLIPFH